MIQDGEKQNQIKDFKIKRAKKMWNFYTEVSRKIWKKNDICRKFRLFAIFFE